MRRNKVVLKSAIALIMMLSAGPAFSEDIIRLSEEVVQRYIATYPNFWKLTKETEKAAKIKNEQEKAAKVEAIANQKNELLKNNQWTDVFEYNDVGSRILQLNIQLNIKGIYAKLQDERNAKAMELIKKLQDEMGFQPEEVKAVAKFNAAINEMYVKAGLRTK